MTEQEIKNNFSKNLSTLRKARSLTQLQLAEKLNYSDKSVSKWEHGDVLPDVATISAIAEYFGVSIDELLASKDIKKPPKSINHTFILALSCGLVLLISCIIFWIVASSGMSNPWTVFLYGAFASAIVAVVLCAIWFPYPIVAISVSILTWITGICVHVSTLVYLNWQDGWFAYIVCAVFQILVGLWFAFKSQLLGKKKN